MTRWRLLDNLGVKFMMTLSGLKMLPCKISLEDNRIGSADRSVAASLFAA